MKRLPLSVRYGQRHTRGRENELVSITYSPLQVRRPRVHVPLRVSGIIRATRKRNSPPIPSLQRTITSLASLGRLLAAE